MNYKNQLIVKNLSERYLLPEPVQTLYATITFNCSNMSEYGTKIQLLLSLFNNLTNFSPSSTSLRLNSRLVSSKKTKGKDKIRKFNFSPIFIFKFQRKLNLFHDLAFINLLLVLNDYINTYRRGRVLITYKKLGPQRICITLNFLNNLFDFRANRVITSNAARRLNFHANDSLNIVFNFTHTRLNCSNFIFDIFKQILKTKKR